MKQDVMESYASMYIAKYNMMLAIIRDWILKMYIVCIITNIIRYIFEIFNPLYLEIAWSSLYTTIHASIAIHSSSEDDLGNF